MQFAGVLLDVKSIFIIFAKFKGFGGSYIMRFGLLAMQKNEFIEPLGISNNGKTVIGGLLWL